MLRLLLCSGICFLLAAPWSTQAEEKSPPAFMQELFPPELVMRHQRDIDLSKDQRRQITKIVSGLQSSVMDIRWEQVDLMGELESVFKKPRVDEKSALAATEKLLKLENQVKLTHVGGLIRIKNVLTQDQQDMLYFLRQGPDESLPD